MAEPKNARQAYAALLAEAFNTSTVRHSWRATVGGTRVTPTVHFISTGVMVRITYHVAFKNFTVEFSRVSVAFGDYMASTYRALSQILGSLKASGYDFCAPVGDSPVLRIEYDPRTKVATIAIAQHGDDWLDAEPFSFKVPERVENNIENPLDMN